MAGERDGSGIEIPAQLWMLWNPETGKWVCSLDDAPHGETFLVALNEREAGFAALHQNESYDLDCYPVRVK
jgi:hypothetical protein